MRMGQPRKKGRGWRRVGGDPRHASPESVVGLLSSDLISSLYAPWFRRIAQQQIAQYAEDLLEYRDATEEAEIGADGEVQLPPAPVAPLFDSQFMIDELAITLKETSDYFFDKSAAWKVHANAAKFERVLDEKYGRFRPFVTQHPEIEQFLRGVQRRYATGQFSPFRDPPIPRSTAIVILFMMQRGGLRWEVMGLAIMFFLVGLQPWALVSVVLLVQMLVFRRQRRPPRKMSRRIPLATPYYEGCSEEEKQELLKQPVGEALLASTPIDMSDFDAMIIGSGPHTLYTAALLSRAGRRVLVLSQSEDASGCVTPSTRDKRIADLPFDIETNSAAKLDKLQTLLAPALCTTNDTQGGVRFAQIGSALDGYAFEILSIPGMGTDSPDSEIPFVLKAGGGLADLMDDAATYVGDGWPGIDGSVGHSTTGQYVQACEQMNATASQFYMSKLMPDNVNSLRKTSVYEESGVRYAASFLDRSFPLNAHARSLLAGMGMKGENIKPSMASMAAHVTNVCACASGTGMHYPIGGPRALCRALANVVEKSGGKVYHSVAIDEFVFGEPPKEDQSTEKSKDEEETDPPAPRCLGVKLDDGREISFSPEAKDADVISSEGFLWSFINALPNDIRTTYKVPKGLPALSARRPVFKVLFALDGSSNDLSITGADYYRLPNASIAFDEIDADTGAVKQGEIGWHDETEEVKDDGEAVAIDAINKAQESTDKPDKKKRLRRTKYEAGYSWIHVAFPSAKDPSFESRHGKCSTCVVTIEADDDFVTLYESSPKLYTLKTASSTQGERSRLMDRVKRDLLEVFPQLEGHIAHSELRGPIQRGLSHTPQRFAAKGIRPETKYPGLYMSGSDLTVGDSFSASIVSGWLAANAVVGYSPLDYIFLQKHVTSDLTRFLDAPDLADEDDVAVPCTPPDAVIDDEDKEM